jgi:tetratricopeptide (TPR) repeat protein
MWHATTREIAMMTAVIALGTGCDERRPAPAASPAALPFEAPDAARPDALRPVDFEPATTEQIALLAAGKKAGEAGDTPRAIQAFEQLATDGPVSGVRASGVIALADLHCDAGEASKGIAVLTQFEGRAPPLAELLYVLGRCHQIAGQREAAIFSYGEALRLQPLLLRAHIEMGGMYGELGEAELSGQTFLAYERAVYRYAGILEDPDAHPADKLKICEAFSYLPDDRAVRVLLIATNDSHADVRVAAAHALGEVGSADLLGTIRQRQSEVAKADPALAQALAEAANKIEAAPAAEKVND